MKSSMNPFDLDRPLKLPRAGIMIRRVVGTAILLSGAAVMASNVMAYAASARAGSSNVATTPVAMAAPN